MLLIIYPLPPSINICTRVEQGKPLQSPKLTYALQKIRIISYSLRAECKEPQLLRILACHNLYEEPKFPSSTPKLPASIRLIVIPEPVALPFNPKVARGIKI